MPSTFQLTAVFVEPETVAVKDRISPADREEVAGFRETLTTTAAACTVTAAEALLAVSARLVAVTTSLPLVKGAV
jgi:uncharacterized DUF497 family protein